MQAGPKIYPMVGVRPRIDLKGEVVLAPFWRARGRASWRCLDQAKIRAYGNARPLGPLLFSAFWSPKAVYYDNLTIRYALEPFAADAANLTGTILDGTRDPGAVAELARLTWLAYLDRVADVTGVELAYSLEKLDYVAIPFFKEGEFVVEGVLGLKLPGAFLES